MSSNHDQIEIQVGQRALSGSENGHRKIKDFGIKMKIHPKIRSDIGSRGITNGKPNNQFFNMR